MRTLTLGAIAENRPPTLAGMIALSLGLVLSACAGDASSGPGDTDGGRSSVSGSGGERRSISQSGEERSSVSGSGGATGGASSDAGGASDPSTDSGIGGSAPYTKSDHGIPWNDTVSTFGTLTDERDGQVYRTVEIGPQTWMAENLNYAPSGTDVSWCYEDSDDQCAKYGRLYTWAGVMEEATASPPSPKATVGICPSGWHVPSSEEWNSLVAFSETDSSVGAGNGGRALKSTSGWDSSEADSDGWDTFGFRGLAAGSRYYDAFFFNAEALGYWWTASEEEPSNAWYCGMNYGFASVDCYPYDKTVAYSLRCLKD